MEDKKECITNIFNKVYEINLKGNNLVFELDHHGVYVYDRTKKVGEMRIADNVYFNSEYELLNNQFDYAYVKMMNELNRY